MTTRRFRSKRPVKVEVGSLPRGVSLKVGGVDLTAVTKELMIHVTPDQVIVKIDLAPHAIEMLVTGDLFVEIDE